VSRREGHTREGPVTQPLVALGEAHWGQQRPPSRLRLGGIPEAQPLSHPAGPGAPGQLPRAVAVPATADAEGRVRPQVVSEAGDTKIAATGYPGLGPSRRDREEALPLNRQGENALRHLASGHPRQLHINRAKQPLEAIAHLQAHGKARARREAERPQDDGDRLARFVDTMAPCGGDGQVRRRSAGSWRGLEQPRAEGDLVDPEPEPLRSPIARGTYPQGSLTSIRMDVDGVRPPLLGDGQPGARLAPRVLVQPQLDARVRLIRPQQHRHRVRLSGLQREDVLRDETHILRQPDLRQGPRGEHYGEQSRSVRYLCAPAARAGVLVAQANYRGHCAEGRPARETELEPAVRDHSRRGG